jgi:hypothetical protein
MVINTKKASNLHVQNKNKRICGVYYKFWAKNSYTINNKKKYRRRFGSGVGGASRIHKEKDLRGQSATLQHGQAILDV